MSVTDIEETGVQSARMSIRTLIHVKILIDAKDVVCIISAT